MAKGNTIGAKVGRMRRRFPRRQKGTGFLHRGPVPPLSKRFQHITVFAIFVSNEGGAFFRDHRFGFSDGQTRTRRQWKQWLDDNYGRIVTEGILPSYQEKYGGFWRLHTMIGWSGHAGKRS